MSNPKHVLLINHSGKARPSAMVRTLQYREFFKKSEAWKARFLNLHSEALEIVLHEQHGNTVQALIELMRKPLNKCSNLWDAIQEKNILRLVRQFDIVSFVKTPHLSMCHRLAEIKTTRTLIDLNDAVWLPAFRKGDWREIDDILGLVTAVICENEFIASYASTRHPHVFIVPDAPQVEAFDLVRDSIKRDPREIRIGWIGGPENIGPLYRIWEPLEALADKYPQIHFRVVGAGAKMLPRFEKIRWSCSPDRPSQLDMVREVLAFDIGVFPLFHNEDALARGTLKAKVYMSGGAAVVCENYGGNLQMIQNGVNGLLASSPDEWYQALEWLIVNPEARAAMAQAGLESIRSQFNAQCLFEKLLAAYDNVVKL